MTFGLFRSRGSQVVHIIQTTNTYTMSNQTQNKSAIDHARSRKVAAALIIIFDVLIFIPLIVLGISIDWPNNLDKDAEHNLPLLLEEDTSVFWGYFAYLVYSILFYPMANAMGSVLAQSDSSNLWLKVGSGFAALSAVARAIGLSRWLFAMPTLARRYVDPNTSDMAKEAISISYEMLNSYGGGIGELLGVSLCAALWVVCTSVLFVQSTEWPTWMGLAGFLVAIDLAINLLEMSILDYDVGINLTLSVVLLHIWLLLAALLFIRLPCLKCIQKKDTECTDGKAEDDHEAINEADDELENEADVYNR